ncbi:MAG: hypothetical protein ACOYX1_18440 [Acidobacteriota bacterium]
MSLLLAFAVIHSLYPVTVVGPPRFSGFRTSGLRPDKFHEAVNQFLVGCGDIGRCRPVKASILRLHVYRTRFLGKFPELSSCGGLEGKQGMVSLPRGLEVEPFDQPVLVAALAELFERFGKTPFSHPATARASGHLSWRECAVCKMRFPLPDQR